MQLGLRNFKKSEVSNELAHHENQDNSCEGEDGRIFFRGWIKYFHYTEQEQTQPKTFFKNVERERENSLSSFSEIMSDKDKVCNKLL